MVSREKQGGTGRKLWKIKENTGDICLRLYCFCPTGCADKKMDLVQNKATYLRNMLAAWGITYNKTVWKGMNAHIFQSQLRMEVLKGL